MERKFDHELKSVAAACGMDDDDINKVLEHTEEALEKYDTISRAIERFYKLCKQDDRVLLSILIQFFGFVVREKSFQYLSKTLIGKVSKASEEEFQKSFNEKMKKEVKKFVKKMKEKEKDE